MSYVALTSAAVSPSIGKYTKYWLRAVMTLLNVRLGTWIPNPSTVNVHMQGCADPDRKVVLQSWLNRVPGPLLWFRELRGRHYVRSKQIYVSDGGHYENLGNIVEADPPRLRRGVGDRSASHDDRGTGGRCRSRSTSSRPSWGVG